MALVFNGIKVSMNGNNIPTGSLPSSFTPIEGEFISVPVTFAIDKSSVEAAVPSDTWNSLISFLDTAIQTKLQNDFDTSQTVTSYAELFGIQSNLKGDANTSDMYKDVVPAYLCSVVMYVKVS
jgi:hypothetical protein